MDETVTPDVPARRRDRRVAIKRARARSRLRSIAAATAVLTGATVLGLGAAGTSYALLNAKQGMPGATVAAGTAELRIENSSAALLSDFAPTPATPAVQAVSVSNVGQVTLALSGRSTASTKPALVSNALLRVTPVSAKSACVPGLAGPQSTLDGYANAGLGSVAPATARILCVEVALRAGTPVEQSGQQFGFEFVVSGAQAGG